MNTYTQLCVASCAVSFGTVAMLLWNGSSRNDMSYIYLSLVAPTVILGYHLLYLFNPFFDLDTTSYTLVSSSPHATATPTTRQNSRESADGDGRPKLTLQTTSSTTSEERNPLVTSTLSILCLILLTVLVGAISLSSGTVAFLNSLEQSSLAKAEERVAMYAVELNVTISELEAGMTVVNDTISVEFAPFAADLDRTTLSNLLGDLNEVSHRRIVEDTTAPPSPVLAMQAILSFVQMILLASMVLIGMRRRVSRYACDYEEEDWEVEWSYAQENADSLEIGEVGIPAHVLDYLKHVQATTPTTTAES